MEWRDIAMILWGFVMLMFAVVCFLIKLELGRKADEMLVNATMRRLDDHIVDGGKRYVQVTANVGELYSKIADEKTDRMQQHIDSLVAQNANQQAVMSTLASITSRATRAEQ